MAEQPDLIGPDETAYSLDLTPSQLKVTYFALKSFFDDLGHDEAEVREIAREVIAKLPDEPEIRAIDLDGEVARRRRPRGV